VAQISEGSGMALQSIIRRRKGREGATISNFVFALLTVLVALPRVASAVPSFASQTGLPCAQCHVMAFGPQLTEFGRQFKLNAYTFAKQDGGVNIPLSATVIAAYSDVNKAAPTPSPYSDKENLALQDVSVYFAGRISDHLGAFVKATYDNISRNTAWDKMDVRYARTVELGGHSAVLGVDVNNNPTVQDLWNSTHAFGFPYIVSELVPFPANTLASVNELGNTVLGGSVYSMIDSRWYVELGFYKGISNKWVANLGLPGANPNIVGAAPYGRLTWHQQTGPHYLEIGLLGFSVKQQPFQPTTSETNRTSDYGIDASYQFNVGTPQAFDAHASWIHENRKLDASFAVGASDSTSNSFDTFEADVSYIIDQTWVPTVSVFNSNGSTNHLMFAPSPIFGSASGAPTTGGYTVRFEWVPFGKTGSFASPWVNLRLGAQYTGYWRFNGGSSNYDGFGRSASDNNSLFVYAWLAF
jgi:hypothetical protein